MGNINYSSLKNISFTKFIGIMLIFPWSTNYKSPYILLGKTIHFCRNDQAQRSSTTKPSWASPAHIQIPAGEAHMSWLVKSQHNLTTGGHHHQFRLVQSDQKKDTCPARVKSFLAKFISSFLMWHDKKLGSFSQLYLLPSPTHSVLDQAHESKWVNLGKCGLDGTKGITTKFPA